MTHTALALKSHSSQSDPFEHTLREAEALFLGGEADQAEQLFQKVLELKPTHSEALNNLGVIAHQRGRREGAIAFFTRALQSDMENQDAALNLSELLDAVPPDGIPAIGRYAYPALLCRLTRGQWGHDDTSLLKKAAGSLNPGQLSFLLEQLMASRGSEAPLAILAVVNAMDSLNDADLLKLGDWLTGQHLIRRLRDQFEQTICIKSRDDQLVRQFAKRDGYFRSENFLPGWERYPRKIVDPALSDDPFMKHVPQGAPDKSTGMRVLIISDFNIAGQCTALMRALNKYTNHMARCIILQDDYLSYDRDLLLRNQAGEGSPAALAEARELIPKADFYHFGRGLFDFPAIDWNKYLSPENCVFQYYGSELRDNGKTVSEFHASTGFQAITAVDLTMYRLLPASYYHLQPYMLEVDQLPQADWGHAETIRICHAPSSANYKILKRSDLIMKTITDLAKSQSGVEQVLIEGVDNKTCLQMKSRCHVHVVSLIPGFGLNTIESAAMGLVPITGFDNFSRLIYPEAPIVCGTAENLYTVLAALVKDRARAQAIGESCREWARKEFNAPSLVKKYWYLYDLIYHGHSVDYPEIFH